MSQAVDSPAMVKAQAIELVEKLARKAPRSTEFRIDAELVGISNASTGYVTMGIVDGQLGQKYKSTYSICGGLSLHRLSLEALLRIAIELA